MLLERANGLAGQSLGDVARAFGLAPPSRPASGKGWAGQLLELALGADGGSAPRPDFKRLGVELKTIPVDRHGRPQESTHVCAAPSFVPPGLRWTDSLVRAKLARVLWIPIVRLGTGKTEERYVGSAMLWTPSRREEEILRRDWEEIVERIALGHLHEVDARMGEALQLRPKAASSRTVTTTMDEAGNRILVNPRGFYLRARFTAQILEAWFLAN